MLTVPITTPYFNLRVLNLLINHVAQMDAWDSASSPPRISPLSALDTNLVPGESVSQLVGIVAPWIDLSSPDPAVFGLSNQVLQMEFAYAAFCGIGNLILPSPRLHYGKKHGEGIAQYAYAVQQALEVASFIHVSILMPMMDHSHDHIDETKGSLSLQARLEFTGNMDDVDQATLEERTSFESQPWELLDVRPRKKVPVSSKHDFYGTWDAWNIVRTVCKYNQRLHVGKNKSLHHLRIFYNVPPTYSFVKCPIEFCAFSPPCPCSVLWLSKSQYL